VGAVAHVHAPGRVRATCQIRCQSWLSAGWPSIRTISGKRSGQLSCVMPLLRTLQAADIAGIRAILVHAISERARQFYEERGFIASPMNPMTLMITVSEAVKA